VKAIIASMERLRWLPHIMEARYIRVNVPDQSADYVADGEVVLHSKVVIGKPGTPTPILRTEVTAVVANPVWDVPGDLAGKYLARVRHNKNRTSNGGFILASAPGAPVGAHPALQQLPGPDNVLGKLMLDMPNDFDVYMHDTPNKKLFTQANREASNGCIRTEQIFAMASLALTEDETAGKDVIDAAIATGATTNLPLPNPLPVYLVYSTAVADADGNAGFRPDRYNRDAPLLALMAKPEKPIAMVSQATSRQSSVRTHPGPAPGSD
jgi:murein L,D-transpeptidase YcbB/YkuD